MVATILALLVTACSPAPSPRVLPGPAVTAIPSTGGETWVFGEIVAFDRNAPSVTLDLRQWFGDPEQAIAAARADGVIGPDEDLPEPFYVRDLHERRTMELDPAATVTVLGQDAAGSVRPTPVTLAELVDHWQAGPPSGAWIPAAYHWCLLRDGKVVAIKAEFTP